MTKHTVPNGHTATIQVRLNIGVDNLYFIKRLGAGKRYLEGHVGKGVVSLHVHEIPVLTN